MAGCRCEHEHAENQGRSEKPQRGHDEEIGINRGREQ
jgi:hypothetical protein